MHARKTLITCVSSMLFVLMLGEPTRCAGQQKTITPDPEIQTAIRSLAQRLIEKDWKMSDEALLEINRFGEKYVGKEAHALQQSLLFRATAATEDAWVAAVMIVWSLEISSCNTLLDAAVPLLDIENKTLRKRAAGILVSVHGAREGDAVDYTCYETWLSRRAPKTPPRSLVRHMVEWNPGMAVTSLSKVYLSTPEARKPLLWAEHVVSDAIWKRKHGFTDAAEEAEPKAIAELETLSRHDAWWVRLYVMEVMKQHRELYNADVMERLEKVEDQIAQTASRRTGA